MELRDLIVTPIIIFLVYAGAYVVRPWVTDPVNRRYFFPGLTVRIIGALAVGFLYQFYYEGGDTFNFHTHGSRHIWNALMDDSSKGLKLLLSDNADYVGVYEYASRIVFITDPSSFFIVRLAAWIDIITFSSYSATAVIFAVIGFAGSWMFFITFYRILPQYAGKIAIATLFVPSVIFWGSGLLKDTITLACIGIAVHCLYAIFLQRRYAVRHFMFLFLTLYCLYVIKIYILLTLLPAAIVWIFVFNYSRIKSLILKVVLLPLLVMLTSGFAYYATLKAGEDNPKYSLQAIAKTAQITAYDIRYWSGREAGSGYSLGELDGTWQSMLNLGPQAINVSLFRPYFWEVRNPLMLLSAMESFTLLILTVFVILKARGLIFSAMTNAHVLFCMIFSITFAFAVGVSTFNFGTLTRYKIPLLPFYLLMLILIYDYSNKERKVRSFAAVEY